MTTRAPAVLKKVIYFNEFMILRKTTVSIKAGWFKAALEKAANL